MPRKQGGEIQKAFKNPSGANCGRHTIVQLLVPSLSIYNFLARGSGEGRKGGSLATIVERNWICAKWGWRAGRFLRAKTREASFFCSTHISLPGKLSEKKRPASSYLGQWHRPRIFQNKIYVQPRHSFLSLLHFLFPYFRSLKNRDKAANSPSPLRLLLLNCASFFLPSPPLSSRWIGRNNKNHGGERGKRGGKGKGNRRRFGVWQLDVSYFPHLLSSPSVFSLLGEARKTLLRCFTHTKKRKYCRY